MRVLYLGEFNLPDGSPAAKRVMSIASYFSDDDLIDFLDYSWSIEYPSMLANRRIFKCGLKSVFANKIKHFFSIIDIKNIMKKNIYDLIICYNYPSIPLKKIIKLCEKKKIKIISDVTEWYNNHEMLSLRNILKNYDTKTRMEKLNKQVDGIICVSHALKEYYNNYTTCLVVPTISIIKNSRRKREFNNMVTFAFVGNCGNKFSKERLDYVIYALDRLYNEGYDFQMKIVGSSLEQLFSNGLIKKEYKFLKCCGMISHEMAIKILMECDFSIIPREKKRNTIFGFPTKLSESLSCGVPVIVTNVGDMSKYIFDDINGFVVENCDIESFYQCLKRIISFQHDDMIQNCYESELLTHNFASDLKLFLNDIINR